jgi:hypothetical protein
VHAGLKPADRDRMAQGMHADTLGAGGLGGGFDDASQVARIDRPAELGGERQAGVAPLITGAQPLGLLLDASTWP